MTNSSNENQALAHWLNARKHHWENLENALKRPVRRPGLEMSDARELLSGYRSSLSDLSLSRRVNGKTMITHYLENLVLKAHEEIYRPSNHPLDRLLDLAHREVPRLMRELKTAIFSSLALFVLSIVAGWFLIGNFPDLISLIASPQMIDQVQQGELWTDGLLNIAPSSITSARIAANNIAVTLFAFALGAFYGVGTLYILGVNGFMLGGIFAFTAEYQLAGRLFAFILAHGVVELSIIIIAGAMGLQLGEALIRPGARYRLQAFQEASVNAGKILLVATPFLIFAGLIEGFVSPDPDFDMLQRTVIGCCSGTIFWLIMLFGVPGRSRH